MRSLARRGIVPALVLGVLASACGGQAAAVTDRPTDVSSARALAKAVASKAGCGALEDFGLAKDDNWAFSCQFGTTDMFIIRTAASPQLRDAARPSSSPYTVGDYYLVTADTASADLERLNASPGELVTT